MAHEEMWWLSRRCGGSTKEMWWLIASTPDFWDRGPGFGSGISRNYHDALKDHGVII